MQRLQHGIALPFMGRPNARSRLPGCPQQADLPGVVLDPYRRHFCCARRTWACWFGVMVGVIQPCISAMPAIPVAVTRHAMNVSSMELIRAIATRESDNGKPKGVVAALGLPELTNVIDLR